MKAAASRPWPGTLPELLARTVATVPDAPAATDGYESLSFAALAERVDRQAEALAAIGIGPGDRVALWMPNGVSYLAAIVAVARRAAIAIHVNTRFRPREIADILRRSRARAIATDPRFEPVDFAGLLAEVRREDGIVLEHALLPVSAEATFVGLPARPIVAHRCSAKDLAQPDASCLTFTTSGTTSAPKLVLHGQGAIARHAAEAAKALGVRPAEDASLCLMPLCGTYGQVFALSTIAGGGHAILLDRFDASRAADLIRRHRVTHMAVTDDVLGRIAAEARRAPMPSVRWSGHASFSPEAEAHVAAAEAAGLSPRALYGSSEVQALFALAPPDVPLVPGGRPVSADARFTVREVETGIPCPDGAAGELWVDAPSRFVGYLDDPASTARAVTADGWFRSGDVAFAHGDRFVFGRRLGDTLRLGGFLVDPAEIEAVLVGAGARGAQVVAVPADGREVAVAFVLMPAGASLTLDALEAACRRDLAPFKQPACIVPIEAFPVTASPNGEKVQKARLRALASDELAQR